jgi:hypothetical protein
MMINNTGNITEVTFRDFEKLLPSNRMSAAPVQTADPGDGLEFEENQSMVIGRYTSLCKTLPLRFLTLDDNLPKCNPVHICRSADIRCTSAMTFPGIILSYTTTKAIGCRTRPKGQVVRRAMTLHRGDDNH